MQIPLIARKPREKPGDAHCHSGPQADTDGLPLVAIVGCPNVGKSVLFNALTGAYVTVSNFPGTTVEVSRGKGRFDGTEVGVVDTPGNRNAMPDADRSQWIDPAEIGRVLLFAATRSPRGRISDLPVFPPG